MALTEHDYAIAREDERRLMSVAFIALVIFAVVAVAALGTAVAVWR
jgi:nitrate reductase NapE component